MRIMLMPYAVLLLSGCAGLTPAQVSAFDAQIAAGQAALVPAEDLACSVDIVADPTGAKAVCYAIDQTGSLVGAAMTVAEDVASIAALAAKTSTAMQGAVKARRSGAH